MNTLKRLFTQLARRGDARTPGEMQIFREISLRLLDDSTDCVKPRTAALDLGLPWSDANDRAWTAEHVRCAGCRAWTLRKRRPLCRTCARVILR